VDKDYLGFISYTRFDDEHNSRIISNSKIRLENEIRSQTGIPYPLFQDVTNIDAGDDWDNTIKKALDASKVFIAFITPSFFASPACIKELEYYFSLLENGEVYRKIIPIYLTSCKCLSAESNKLLETIFKIQYEDWRYLRNTSSDSAEFKESIFKLGCKISGLHIFTNRTDQEKVLLDATSSEAEDKTTMHSSIKKEKFPNEAKNDFSKLIPHYYSMNAISYGELSNGNHEDAIIFSKSNDMATNVTVVIYNEAEKKPFVIYSALFEDSFVEASFETISRHNQKILIIRGLSGSGRYLHYVVLGYVDGILKILLERNSIYDGSIFISDRKLLEIMGRQGILFEWDGHTMLATQLLMQPIPPRNIFDKVVEYSILTDGTVHIECESIIHMQIGQSLQINRTNTGIVERILYSGNGVLEYINSSATAVRQGTTSIQIIPGGYDWEKALTLTIIVE